MPRLYCEWIYIYMRSSPRGEKVFKNNTSFLDRIFFTSILSTCRARARGNCIFLKKDISVGRYIAARQQHLSRILSIYCTRGPSVLCKQSRKVYSRQLKKSKDRIPIYIYMEVSKLSSVYSIIPISPRRRVYFVECIPLMALRLL